MLMLIVGWPVFVFKLYDRELYPPQNSIYIFYGDVLYVILRSLLKCSCVPFCCGIRVIYTVGHFLNISCLFLWIPTRTNGQKKKKTCLTP